MNKERKDEFEAWETQQRRLGEFITEAGKTLKLEESELVRAVADWLYTEADVDYFKEAAEKDEDDLPEFVEAAIKAWLEYNQQPGGPHKKLTVADAMSIIISVAAECATAADACATEPEKVKPNANQNQP